MTINPADVNTGASAIAESTRKAVYRCKTATSLFRLCTVLMLENRKMRKQLDRLRILISNLAISEESDREPLRKSAEQLGECAAEWDRMHRTWVSEIAPRFPDYIPLINQFGSVIARQLGSVACMTEDIAETLALAASTRFVRLVNQEIEANPPGPVQSHKTAKTGIGELKFRDSKYLESGDGFPLSRE